MIPFDIILSIFKLLTYKDIINFSYVSRSTHNISTNNNLWLFLINRDYPYSLSSYYFNINYHKYVDIYKVFDRFKNHICKKRKFVKGTDLALLLNSIHKISRLLVTDMFCDPNECNFSSFTELIWIHLGESLHRCPIDYFCLNNMKSLKYLYISDNNLRNLPLIICKLITLEEIDMSSNELSDLPSSFSTLVLLKKLVWFTISLSLFLLVYTSYQFWTQLICHTIICAQSPLI